MGKDFFFLAHKQDDLRCLFGPLTFLWEAVFVIYMKVQTYVSLKNSFKAILCPSFKWTGLIVRNINFFPESCVGFN